TDGDGVVDIDDACPKVAGPAENKGCPWPDTDGDGVFDKDDKCPNEAGPASNNGCPETISDADLAKINELAKGVYFKSESAEFTEEMPSRLDMIAEILKENSNDNYTVEGHCDSRGPEGYNNKLSEARANTVKEYLISRGVSADDLSIEGLGKSQPAQDNSTSKGRAANRRVEFKASK
ncbi:MAG: OmpA family protein, partial [Bacteroidetes bacterium]|nr:OmpA family protein [Bacteroidota bacterium]